MKPKHAADLAKQYRVTDGRNFRLKDFDPGDTWKLESKEKAAALLEKGVARLSALQDTLYAQDKWAVLLVFQAMDAAGKDSTIKHVMSGVNPQGCQVFSFKAPTAQELDHDFLWRTNVCLPERGRIGIFNRSYYEETLVVRVHPEFLHTQKLPEKLIGKKIWKERFEDINAYERYLSRNGVVIRKFFLHVSKEEQRRRFLARLEEKEKNWKFSAADLKERALWDKYQEAYEETIRHTSTEHAPWHVIPADHKWFTRLAVSAAIIETLESLDLAYPKLTPTQEKELAGVRDALLREKKS
jgi:PPK2 family polyphosphate:nucleotide phosphotransferase